MSTIRVGKPIHGVSPLLFGLFLEDINYSCDGGLNNNLIANHSFDGVYWNKEFSLLAGMGKVEPQEVQDHLRYWAVEGGKLEGREDAPLSKKNPYYARFTVDGKGTLCNLGYNGNQKHAGEAAMSIVKGHAYDVSFFLRSADFKGEVKVCAANAEGKLLTTVATLPVTGEWTKTEATVQGVETDYGMLVVEVTGKGYVDLDCGYFGDADYWGKGDPKWTGGRFRKDLVQSLKDLNPTFLRFPGGCITEGHYPGNEYQWKNTIGPVQDRIPAVNLWAAAIPDKGYDQSYQIGFYEYFLLCEELGMEPLPIVWAGLTCQYRSEKTIPTDSAEFDEKVLANAMDLVEYALGDPATSKWAKLRADAGHPAPFPLHMIGVGNENYGDEYVEKFTKVKNAIDAKYPGLTFIMSGGGMPEGPDIERTWRATREGLTNVRVDEHFYKTEDWVYTQINRYDNYDRNGAHVFLGEYAATDLMALMAGMSVEDNPTLAQFATSKGDKPAVYVPNQFGSALSEAAFLTGIERNSDIVDMTSYAPLFSLVDGQQWPHNLINFNPAEYIQTTNYQVQALYGNYQGKEVLDMCCDLPEGVYASAVATDDEVIVKLVNANAEPVCVTIETEAKGAACAKVMQNDDLTARNVLPWKGEADYGVVIKDECLANEDGKVTVEAKKYGFYVIIIKK